MNKEQQDIAWACLPKEMRERIKEVRFYFYHPKDHPDPKDQTTYDFFGEIFGTHNLESAAEPEEMLCISRKSVQELYVQNEKDFNDTNDNWFAGYITALKDCFGDKCIPDKELNEDNFAKSDKEEQAKPQFSLGDKVKIIDYDRSMSSLSFFKNKICIIKGITSIGAYKLELIDDFDKRIKVNSCNTAEEFIKSIQWDAKYLEHYTEPESKRKKPQDLSLSDNQQTDDMEEKELNLFQSDEELDNLIKKLIAIRNRRRKCNQELTDVLRKFHQRKEAANG